MEVSGDSPLRTAVPPVLQDIIAEIAGLVRSREVTERSDRRIQHLLTLNELNKTLHQPVPFVDILPFILKISHNYTGSSCTVLRIFRYDCFSPKVLKTCGRRHRSQLKSLLEIEKECSKRILATGTPLLTIDVIADEDLPPSYVCVPLHYESQTFGTLTFFGKTGREGIRRNFDEEDRELFAGMANLIATSLVGVRNFRRMTMLAVENDRKLKEISLLYRLSNAMHSTTRINKLIHLNLSAIVSGSHPLFERAMLFLVNKRSGVMQGMLGVTSEACNGIASQPENNNELLYTPWELADEEMERQQNSDFCQLVKGTRLPVDKAQNMPSRVVLEKKLILTEGGTTDSNHKGAFVEKFRLAAYAGVPLIAKGEAIAVVMVDNPFTGKTIGADDLRFLQMLANQAGMAIENSMLYNRIEDTNREFMQIRQRLLQGERLASLGESAASIAHDLKGPLVAISGLARRLSRKETHGSTEWRYAETIAREADRLGKMLGDILFFTKRTTICYSDCPLKTIIEESLEVVSGFLEENGIRVKKRFSARSLDILGDFQQLKQVCINLFTNAGDAMKQGGVLSVSLSSTVLDARQAVSLKVRDTGGGISEDILPNIFNPFYTTKEGGTGLGLPIVHRIITNHGGKIQVSNRPGTGAEFRIILPVHP
jgi:signal transduction histidine kinase